jgi:ribosomal protein L14E/L6E/L27E
MAITKAEKFQEAFEAFIPAPDDNPDCIPFYATWRGLDAAWGSDFCNQYHSAVHQACGDSGYGGSRITLAERYQAACTSLRYWAEKAEAPQEPASRIFWMYRPQEPAEARALFAGQFRQAFPGQRINSKLAKEKWEEVKGKAFEVVAEQYQAALAHYEAEKAKVDGQNAAEKATWQEKRAALEVFKALVLEVTSEVQAAEVRQSA